ncbi:MAG: hypothetical protein HY665_09995 [Chloroflexi bacterium]|nr:hypothetical protein [Chloroflexota bacterium]
MAKTEANRSATTLARAPELSGPICGASFVSDYLSRTLVEGYGYSKSDLLDLDGHAHREEQSVRGSATEASELSEPAIVRRIE